MLVLIPSTTENWSPELSIGLTCNLDISILGRFPWTCKLLEMPEEIFETDSESALLFFEAVGKARVVSILDIKSWTLLLNKKALFSAYF